MQLLLVVKILVCLINIMIKMNNWVKVAKQYIQYILNLIKENRSKNNDLIYMTYYKYVKI